MSANNDSLFPGVLHRGIVHKLEPGVEAAGGELTFSPDYTVTSTDDDGGRVLTGVEVILVFWGSFWSTTPPPSPSRAQYEQAMEGIVTGPYLTGLGQYRGVGPGSIVFSEIFDGTSPANNYTDADVVAMLKGRFANNASMPKPAAGHNRFYAVIAPQGVSNSLTQFAGQHQSLTYNGHTAYYAWVDNTGSLTGSNSTTKVFSHELVEACTNPDVDTSNNSILVQGTKPGGGTVKNDEIGDTCNGEFATVDMNGITCSVQSYWSKSDNTCVLPLGSVSFWVDKDTFGKDEVQDLISTTGGRVENAFWLVVEGFSQTTFGSLNVSISRTPHNLTSSSASGSLSTSRSLPRRSPPSPQPGVRPTHWTPTSRPTARRCLPQTPRPFSSSSREPTHTSPTSTRPRAMSST